jgi:glycosyltransferase involved in cell wall biosynthesis
MRSNLEGADATRVWGWAWDETRPAARVRIVIRVDGIAVAETLAATYRADLAAAGIGDGAAAFDIFLPEPLDPSRSHRIEILADGAPVYGSPVALPPRDAPEQVDLENLRQTIRAAIAASGTAAELAAVLAILAEEAARAAPTPLLPELGDNIALVIDDALPRATRDAGSQAILSHMRSLSRLGFTVLLIPGQDAAPDPEAAAAMQAMGLIALDPAAHGGVAGALRALRGRVRVVYLHRLSNALRWMEPARAWCGEARIVYSLADLHGLRLARMGQALGGEDGGAVAAAEARCIAASDVAITHSHAEAALLAQTLPQARVRVVPWSVALPPAAEAGPRRGIAFIGNYAHAPNLDAAAHLLHDIMPRVHAQDPAIVLRLVGSAMPAALRAEAREGVETLGHVPDLAALLATVRLTVAPLRFGAGVNGKVLDSLAAGVPCLCSPLAMEGLGVPPGMEDCVAEGAEAFAAAILRLYHAPERLAALGRAGRDWVDETLNEARIDAAMRAALA